MDNNPNAWVPWSKYWTRFPNHFPTSSTASHFVQSRKARMVEAGVLRESTKGYLVHADNLDAILLDLITGAK